MAGSVASASPLVTSSGGPADAGERERLAKTVTEMQQIYPRMDALMVQMRAALSGGGASAAELAEMAAEMQAITGRIQALKVQRVNPAGNEPAAIGAQIADITSRINALKSAGRAPSAGELAAIRADLEDATRRMNALMLRRQSAATPDAGTDMPLKLQRFNSAMQDAARLMQEIKSNPSPDSGRAARLQNMLVELQVMLDDMRAGLQGGTSRPAPGLSSPLTAGSPRPGPASSADFNNQMNGWLGQMRANASSKTSGGMMAGMMQMMGGMMGGMGAN
jgi:hypothetical protein